MLIDPHDDVMSSLLAGDEITTFLAPPECVIPPCLGGEQAGGFQNHVDIILRPRQVGWVPYSVDLDVLPLIIRLSVVCSTLPGKIP